MEYQLYLNDIQKNRLIEYIKDKRQTDMMIMIASLVIAVTGFLFRYNDFAFLNAIKDLMILFFFAYFLESEFYSQRNFIRITTVCMYGLYNISSNILIFEELLSYSTERFLSRMDLCISFLISAGIFVWEFNKGFGKTFGQGCDIQCIEKDLYTLEYANFGYREKDTKKHPYYICDNKGETYICPEHLDYKNADTSDKFLYIKLNNGRGYAIGDHI